MAVSAASPSVATLREFSDGVVIVLAYEIGVRFGLRKGCDCGRPEIGRNRLLPATSGKFWRDPWTNFPKISNFSG